MVGKLLVRGMLAGIAAGLLTFGFARLVGEPQVDQAISFEEKADAAKGEAPEPELVSRGTQAGLGLLTGVVTYGAAFGGLFSLVFAYAYGRVGALSARALSAWLALGAFITLVIVPNIKYPANPPSVGDPETIGMRTGLFFLMIAISLAAMVFSLKVRRRAALTLGAWNGSIVAGVVFVAIIAAVQLSMPTINEVPAAFPAVLLWKFRVAAIGMQVIMWTTVGLLFGAMVERSKLLAPASRSAAKSAYL
ncbi:CbtA family protein [Paraburkholderia domus]|jgi:Probable cobalt transporter subunit (CbtA).|uniref:Cobalt transporter subunit (CbtA) n=1 Tax=Paraburkholderia domus TaxID=2793075 RepID=A0A9N8QXS0_9BURK|nr:CbtA family protein [Paraburkholderia domus]MBK5051270.1 CbtA family protein [Burkholderia sp. R-70006]MBK5061242.1 CbtA family protein [Burkholderia sp. R-70199]MBK5121029.1 CbtA family protein [Burkholderia sp. R-69980]MBK5166437.1 CbtA family protein [Burkholderia sp. R-70211]MBK5185032.1 CbtA family protein [Burkholderia sp. R-69749]